MRGMRTPDPDLFFMSVVEAVVGIVSGGIGSEVKIHFKTFDFLPSNEISCLLLYDTYFQLFLKAVIVFSSIFSNLFFFYHFHLNLKLIQVIPNIMWVFGCCFFKFQLCNLFIDHTLVC